MFSPMHHALRSFSLALPVLVASLPAQWPANPSNLPIGNATGTQNLAKVGVTSDGGCYIGWFDNRGGSYAIYVQRYDPAGNELWTPGGMLVSGHPQSTALFDWDLRCDDADHCVLALTDTRAGSDLDVHAYRLAPDGTFVWGANGITLSTNADSEANPRLCQAGDGAFVFVWTNSTAKTVQLQRVDAAGTVQFPGDGIAIPGDVGQTPAFARVTAGAPGTGDVIVGWVRASAFSAAKHIHAQKFDALGAPLWNAGTRIAVFDLASLPIAHDPKLQSDGAGGAIFSWHYAAGTQFFARVQHIASGGSEVFPHDGVNVSASAGSTFDPAAVWAPASSEIFVAWNERNLGQSSWGIYAQKLDAAGAPQWGPLGVNLLPIDNVVKFAPVAAPLRAHPANDGFSVSVLVESLGLGMKSVQTFGLTSTGAAAWPAVVTSTVASDKMRLVQAATPSGTQILAWTDKRSVVDDDIYAAAVDARGMLGVQIATAALSGCGNNPPGSLLLTGRPAIGTTMLWSLTNPLGTQAAGSVGAFFLTFATPGFPCCVPVPGLGMAGPGAPGDVNIDITIPHLSFVSGLWNGPGTFVTQSFAMPFDGTLIGLPLWLQGLLVDFSPGAPVPFGLGEGAQLVVGS